jgi:hypothetical protein
MRGIRSALFASSLLVAQSCATSGLGSGVLVSGRQATPGSVVFAWRASPDVTRGAISAELPDGRAFVGEFMQITSTTEAQDLTPYWSEWGRPSRDGDSIGLYNDPAAIRHYSGHVIAQLHAADGQRMRCDFHLVRPENGPRSGGAGQCELSSGERIEYAELGE